MHSKIHQFNLRKWLFGAAMVAVAGCSNNSTSSPNCKDGDSCDEQGTKKEWVIDLRKTAPYGAHSAYFWGLSLDELKMQALAQVLDAQNLDEGASSAFAAFGAEGATFKIIWDQVQSITPGWPTVIFPDAVTAHGALPQMNAALPQVAEGLAALGVSYNAGMEYKVVLIDKDGRALAVPGHLDIIPMLKNTAPKEQTNIIDALESGDVISYVHPEQNHMGGLLERRASHVAMHYEDEDSGLVHHIDNPNGYGPPYNHAPDRHMPFHAFRYQPKTMDPATARQYGEAARNWAFITNDLSPFAGFFDLRLQSYDDLSKFAQAAVQNQNLPGLYCSGLAYTNLNLGINKPQNEAGLGDAMDTFTGSAYWFSDAGREYTGASLLVAEDLSPVGQLAFQPYTGVDMLNVWVGNTFRGFPPAVNQAFVPEFLKNPQLHEELGRALRALQWSDAEDASDVPPEEWVPVANAFNVAAWGVAYGLELQGKDGQALAQQNPIIKKRDGSEAPLSEEVDAKDMSNKSPIDIMQTLYRERVKNLFVPPRIWLDEGQIASNNIGAAARDRDMQYVGTVINCELLSSAAGDDADPCAGSSSGEVDEYAEGGADTHTYSHYAVRNGGERTHRRIDASAGPKRFGPGTEVTVRVTGNIQDIRLALHVPENWQELPNHAGDSITEFDGFCNEQWEAGATCAPSKGIYLDVSKQGITQDLVHNEEMTFALIGEENSPCKVVSDEKLECEVINLQTLELTSETISRQSHGAPGFDGHFTATMLDAGDYEEASDCSIRDQLDSENPQRSNGCMSEAGSGHFDVFHIKVRND